MSELLGVGMVRFTQDDMRLNLVNSVVYLVPFQFMTGPFNLEKSSTQFPIIFRILHTNKMKDTGKSVIQYV